MLLLKMVNHTPIFDILIPTFLHCVLQKILEVKSIGRIKNNHRSNYLRQENEDQFWFIRSCPFKMTVTGINIDSTAELYDRSVIIAFKETITTIQG